VYNVKVLNKDAVAHDFTIEASGLEDIEVDYGAAAVHVEPGDVASVPLRIRVPREELEGGADIQVTVRTEGTTPLEAHGKARFLAPHDD
jgi:uncharacterized membrane protein